MGAGPAGLSAAVYMGRFRRRTLVIDAGDGRWSYGQTNDNYLGFPRGVSGLQLHRLGRAQAERFGVRFREGTVAGVRKRGALFEVDAGRRVRARTLIWAAGVRDRWPRFPGARRLVGSLLFWCIVCDGWRTLDRPTVLLGDDDKAARTALQFLTYTRKLTLVTRPKGGLPARLAGRLEEEGIAVVRGTVRRAEVGARWLRAVVLSDGTRIRADLLFSLYGSEPNTGLLRRLPVRLARNGHVRTDEKGRTSLRRFFAAGDVTNRHVHQVASAVLEGAEAALVANHALYPERQKL